MQLCVRTCIVTSIRTLVFSSTCNRRQSVVSLILVLLHHSVCRHSVRLITPASGIGIDALAEGIVDDRRRVFVHVSVAELPRLVHLLRLADFGVQYF